MVFNEPDRDLPEGLVLLVFLRIGRLRYFGKFIGGGELEGVD